MLAQKRMGVTHISQIYWLFAELMKFSIRNSIRRTIPFALYLSYNRDTRVVSKQMGKEAYELRCLRCVRGRLAVPWGQTQAVCPYCGEAWRITWVTPVVAKIRGRLLSKETP
ncbi:MAG: hypothetical protein R6V59_05155 [Dehalococcoidia bacterium]